MRLNKKCLVLVTAVLLQVVQVAQAQDFSVSVPVVFSQNNSFALLDIESEGDNSLEFNITPPTEAGNSLNLNYEADKILWLNYTSLIENSTRSIKAKIDGGILPDGIYLKVRASSYSGRGEGSLGESVGEIELSAMDQTIITGVGNCYTGDGVNNGHSLSFSLKVDDFEKLALINSSSITILYTILEN